MKQILMQKSEGYLNVFWIILGILLSLLFLKIYYIIDISSKSIITNIEMDIAVYSYLYDFIICILTLLLIGSGIILKIKKQKIFKDKKAVLVGLLLSLLIIITVSIFNNNSERNIIVEGDFLSQNQQVQMLKPFNKYDSYERKIIV